MIKFIERLFIKHQQKRFAFMLKHCDRVDRYLVCNLWTGKFYFTMPEYELMNYEEIWYQSHLKWLKRGWLVLIK